MSDTISEMVQDRDMVTMKSKSKSYVAYQMGTVANAIEWPWRSLLLFETSVTPIPRET